MMVSAAARLHPALSAAGLAAAGAALPLLAELLGLRREAIHEHGPARGAAARGPAPAALPSLGRQRRRSRAARRRRQAVAMDQQRNLFVAIGISIAILIGFQFFYRAEFPPKPVPPQTADRSRQSRARRRLRADRGLGARRSGRASKPAPRESVLRRSAARRDRDAPAQGLDRSDRRADRRSDPGRLSRDRRPQQPRDRAAGARRHGASLFRCNSAGSRAIPRSRCPDRIRAGPRPAARSRPTIRSI